MSSKSLSQIKVGDRVRVVASYPDKTLVGREGIVSSVFMEGTVDENYDVDLNPAVPSWVLVIAKHYVEKAEEIEESVILQIRARRDAGREKYKTTMERQDLTLAQRLQHLQEELLDAAIYVEKLKREGCAK